VIGLRSVTRGCLSGEVSVVEISLFVRVQQAGVPQRRDEGWFEKWPPNSVTGSPEMAFLAE
jgi:hypothetical protein